MQANVKILSNRAIDAALKNNWQDAINYNLEILKKMPNDKNAKIRLGRAYIQTKNFGKAKKMFQEVLKVDPINKVAQKNLQMASQKKTANHNGDSGNHTKALIKEPGTTTEVVLQPNNSVLENLEPGQSLNLRITKSKLTFLTPEENKEVGYIKDERSAVVYKANQNKQNVSANVASIDENRLAILLKCKKPIFKARKQQEKPYLKKGLIDEPELEIPEHADADLDE